jgi:hypothetical protein
LEYNESLNRRISLEPKVFAPEKRYFDGSNPMSVKSLI